MMALPAGLPAELVDKLAKVAGLLASDLAGERSAAAWHASQIIREAGLTWRDIIEAAGRTPIQFTPSPALSWRSHVDACLAAHWRLTEWEVEFVVNLARYRRRPTEKQLQLLRKLHQKVTAA